MSDLHAAIMNLDQPESASDFGDRLDEQLDAAYKRGFRDARHAAAELALSAPAVPQWVPVSERLPESGQIVLACYTNRAGNVRRIRAQWVAAKTSEYVGDGDFGEYDEATDTYYDPEGWYECIDNWDDYSSVMVREGDITDWQPLAAAPSAKEPQT